MTDEELFTFYEKLYFHEIDIRDKINGRLQIPLAILVTLSGGIAYLFQNVAFADWRFVHILFFLPFILSVLFAVLAFVNFVKSWRGYDYEYLPTATDTKEYRCLLVKTYEDWDDHEKLVSQHLRDYLQRYYIECSAANTLNNDKKAFYLHKTSKHILYTVAFVILSFIPFHFGELKSVGQEMTVKCLRVNGQSREEVTMDENDPKSQDKDRHPDPPKPPPPPPKRIITEGEDPAKSNKGRDEKTNDRKDVDGRR